VSSPVAPARPVPPPPPPKDAPRAPAPAVDSGRDTPNKGEKTDYVGTTARRQLEKTRAGRTALGFWETLSEHEAVLAANAMAFDAFLSLIPLLAMAGAAVSTFGRPEHVEWLLVNIAPVGTQAILREDVSRPVIEAFQLSKGALGAIAPVSFLVFLWLSSGGIATAISVCERMYHVSS